MTLTKSGGKHQLLAHICIIKSKRKGRLVQFDSSSKRAKREWDVLVPASSTGFFFSFLLLLLLFLCALIAGSLVLAHVQCHLSLFEREKQAESGARTTFVHTYGATKQPRSLSLSLRLLAIRLTRWQTAYNFQLRQNCASHGNSSSAGGASRHRERDDCECHAHSSPARFAILYLYYLLLLLLLLGTKKEQLIAIHQMGLIVSAVAAQLPPALLLWISRRFSLSSLTHRRRRRNSTRLFCWPIHWTWSFFFFFLKTASFYLSFPLSSCSQTTPTVRQLKRRKKKKKRHSHALFRPVAWPNESFFFKLQKKQQLFFSCLLLASIFSRCTPQSIEGKVRKRQQQFKVHSKHQRFPDVI